MPYVEEYSSTILTRKVMGINQLKVKDDIKCNHNQTVLTSENVINQ